MANRSKDPVIEKRLADATRSARLARTQVAMKEVDHLRITVGPRHPAHEDFRAAYLALVAAKKKLSSA